MARFFVEPHHINDDQALITGADAKHIIKVLRLKTDELVTILDGNGNKYQGTIKEINRDTVMLHLGSKQQALGQAPISITLAQCLPKGDKLELVIQKGTELGVDHFVPLRCTRSVVKLDHKKGLERRERWQRVAMEAAKQCRRPTIPQVHQPRDLVTLLSGAPANALILMPFEEEIGSLKAVLDNRCSANEIYIIIGPEGGFDPEEVALAKDYGAQTVSLGPRILRTETAGLALVSVLMHRYGDLG